MMHNKACRLLVIASTTISIAVAGSLAYLVVLKSQCHHPLWTPGVLEGTGGAAALLGVIALGVSRRARKYPLIALLISVGVIAIVTLTYATPPRTYAWTYFRTHPHSGPVCYFYLDEIDWAKNRLAQKFHLQEGTDITWEQLTPYLDDHRQIYCPAGGTITISKLGIPASCSVHEREQRN